MTTLAFPHSTEWRTIRRTFKSPKGNLVFVLGLLTVLAAMSAGPSLVLPDLMLAVGAASLVDIVIQRIERGTWAFPLAGVLSGMIVALILSPYDSWIIAPATAVLAITTKHLFRAGLSNIFNPAALALVAAALLFDAGHSWWGALPDWSWAGAAVVLLAGWHTASRINKLPLVLVFLGAFYALFTLASFLGDSTSVSSVFRAPDLQAALFFALFMLDDPPTCPVKYRDQVVFGAIVAIAAFVGYEYFGWLYYMLAGLLVGNAWWAAQRTWRANHRVRPARVVAS